MNALALKFVSVGGKRLRVRTGAIEHLGTYHHDDALIQLNSEQSPKSARDTLRHEMVHAALAISGISYALKSGIEEALVRALDSIFFPAWDAVQTKLDHEKTSNKSSP